MLLTWHNVQYYQDLMWWLKKSIGEGTLNAFVERFHKDKEDGDIEPLLKEK